MLQLAVDTAKSEDLTSIYSKFASINVVQRAVTANLLNGNLQFAPVTDTWLSAELHDTTALLPQRNIPRIERTKQELQAYKAQAETGAARSPHKSYAEKIGSLASCDDVMSLAVNSSNVSAAFVNVKDMEAKQLPCIHISFVEFVLGFFNADFHAWMRSPTGGGDSVHLTIFSFINRITLHIAKFATHFKNLNVIDKGLLLTELDLEHLKKAVEISKNMVEYFRRKIICG